MLSPEDIRREQQKAAEKAAAEKREPFVYWPGDRIAPPYPLPFIGDYQPPGWEPLGEARLVDGSGLGAEDEPALTRRGFEEWVTTLVAKHQRDTVGWVITSVGQFQVRVQPFTKVKP